MTPRLTPEQEMDIAARIAFDAHDTGWTALDRVQPHEACRVDRALLKAELDAVRAERTLRGEAAANNLVRAERAEATLAVIWAWAEQGDMDPEDRHALLALFNSLKKETP